MNLEQSKTFLIPNMSAVTMVTLYLVCSLVLFQLSLDRNPPEISSGTSPDPK